MKLLFIRHGDPDYENDTLTERGWMEAGHLADRLAATDVKEFFVSPLGRARDTASVTLKKMGRTAEECPWLEEFSPRIHRPDRPESLSISWDWLPQDWTADERFYQYDHWFENEIMKAGNVRERYDWVVSGLDRLLEGLGYVRDGHIYRAVRPSNDSYVFFCHFGVQCVLLGHLIGVSPMVLWHGLCAAPTGITTVATEERRQGIASFRVLSFGDTAHLYENGVEPSFHARFRETITNDWERQD